MTTKEEESYPEDPPAGYCILSNGDDFAYSKPIKTIFGVKRIMLNGHSSREHAIKWAWIMREYHIPKDDFPAAPYIPVNPELCRNEK